MVATVVGARLGLEQTSGWVLGSRGQLGASTLGRGGEGVTVNAQTGNLVITNQDEFLIGRGPDSVLSRTYNSQGALDGDNNDGWRLGVARRVFGLTGTQDQSGSTITRVDWDGSQVVYRWDVDHQAYVTTEGSGAYDKLKKVGTSWVWTDGDSRTLEVYEASGVAGEFRLATLEDIDSRKLTFSYNGSGYISRVTTLDGGYTDLTWSGSKLTQLTTTYWDVATSTYKTQTRTRYAYDSQDRLSTVTVDLSPTDNSISDGRTYVTTYTYHGTSTRVASISQTDGSRIDIAYESGGAYRVTSITQSVAAGVSRTTSYNYVSSARTEITGPDGLITALEYNASGWLTKIVEPAATAGGTPQVREFTYDQNGNVIRIQTSPTTWTEYRYDDTDGNGSPGADSDGNGLRTDENGLWTHEYRRTASGAFLSARRTYDARGLLLTDTRFQSLDSNTLDTTMPADPLTSRYVYDAEGHLRFTVGPDGEVTRHDYAPNGSLIQTTTFTGAAYPVSGLAWNATIPESTLDSWAAGLADKTAARIQTFEYDFRGTITSTTAYSKVLSTGLPDTAAPSTRTNYVYDQAGRLLSRAIVGVTGAETFVYDGLGRMVSTVDFNGATTSSVFHDALGATVVRQADGLSQVSVYNLAGERISYSETERGANLVNLDGWPQGAAPGGTATVPGWGNPAGYTNETQWAVVSGPDGRDVVAIQSGQTNSSVNGGGNFTNAVPIDPSRTYEFVFYFRKADLTRHNIYFGLQAPNGTVEDAVTGADNNNPYFLSASPAKQQNLFQDDRWYKVVGYVLPQGSALIPAGSMGGVYDTVTGAKVSSTVAYRWNDVLPSAPQVQGRFFNYYDEASPGFTTYFYQASIREHLAELTPESGRQYRYDNMGRLRVEIDPTGVATHHLYDRVGRKVAEIDGDGSLVEFKYDQADRLVATVRYATRLTPVQIASLTDAAGNPTGVELAAVRPAGVADDSWTWTIHDDAGRVLQTIDGTGSVTAYVYDGASRLLSETRYDTRLTPSQLTSFKANPPAAVTLPTANAADRTSRYFYDASGRRIGALDAEGYFSRVVYDRAGQAIGTQAFAEKVTNTTLLASGSYTALLTEVQSPANPANISTWSVYDGRGFLRGTVNGEGEVTLYDYTPMGHLTQVVTGRKLAAPPTSQPTLAQLTAAPASPVIETVNYTRNAYGQILTESRAVAGGTETITYTYDALRRLVRVATDVVSGADRIVHQRYDRRGRLIGQLSANGADDLAALGANPTKAQLDTVYRRWGTTFVYDDSDRLIARFDADGTYAAAGARTLYFYDADGRLRFEVNPQGEVVQHIYDALGRLSETRGHINRITHADLAGGLDLSLVVSRVINSSSDRRTAYAYNVDDTLRTSTVWVKSAASVASSANAVTTTLDYNAFREVKGRTDQLGVLGGAVVNRLTTYARDRRGAVTATIEDSGGQARTTTAAYDAFGRAITTTDGNNKTRSSSFDRAGRVLELTDALGNKTTYGYDARGNTISVKDRLNKTTTFSYNAFNRQVVMVTPEGVQTTTAHDDRGLVISVTDGAGRTESFNYDRNGNLVASIDGRGKVTAHEYDFADRLYETTDATGRKIRYGYDAAGRQLTRAVDPLGLNLVTTYVYDGLGRALRVTDASGVRTDYTFDNVGRTIKTIVDPLNLALTTEYTFDRQGNATRVREAVGAGTAERDTAYTYDTLNRLTYQQTGDAGLNIRTAYDYDANGNVVRRRDGVSTGLDVATRYVYDDENRLILTVDPTGAVSRNEYDAEGRVIRITAYATQVSLSGTTLSASQVLSALSGSDYRTTDHVYDSDGRLTYTVQADGRLTRYAYDGAGNVVAQTVYGKLWQPYDPNYALAWPYTVAGLNGITGQSIFKNDPTNRTTFAVYDAANRQTFAVDAMGQVSGFTYDDAGRVIVETRFATTYAGAISEAALTAWSATPQAGDRKTRIAYDAAGRKSFVVDAEGYATRTTYHPAGQIATLSRFAPQLSVADGVSHASLTSLVAPHVSTASTTTYGYDTAGRHHRTIDAENVETRLTLDGLGRTTQVEEAFGTTDLRIITRTYDDAGRLTLQTTAPGQPDQVALSWTYDGLGNVLTAVDGNGHPTVFTYDAMGRVLSRTAPISSSATAETFNTYDAFGNLVKVVDPRGNAGFFYYDSLNRQYLQVDPEGYATRTTYGNGGEVASVTRYALKTTGAPTTTSPPTINTSANDAVTTFVRDKLDRVTQTIDAEGKTETSVLNAFGDRTSVTNKVGAVTTYTYDKRGLMLTETLPVSAVRGDGVVLATSVVNTYEYDARGNLKKTIEASNIAADARTTNYAYDKLDRLTQKSGDAVTVTSATDFSTSSATPTETIAYDKRGNVIETVNAAGARTLFYYDDNNRKIAEVDALGTLRTWAYDDNDNATQARVYNIPVTLPAAPGGDAPTGTGAYRQTSYAYDRNNRLISTSVAGLRTGQYVSGMGYVTSLGTVVTAQAYDAAGNVTEVTDGRGVKSYSLYDKLGRQIAAVDGEGYLTVFKRDAEGNVVREIRFAEKARAAVGPNSTILDLIPASALPPAGQTEPVPHPNLGDRVTDFTYDRNGRRLTEIRRGVAVYAGPPDPDRMTVADATINYAYDGLGNVTRKTEANGDYVDFTYDGLGRQTRALASAFTDYLGASVRRETVTAYNGLGAVTRLQDGKQGGALADARVTAFTYDKGRLLSVSDPTGFTRNFGYDAAGRLTRESYDRLRGDGVTVTEGRRYAYDLLGRVTLESSASTNGTWSFGDGRGVVYNAHGEVTQKTLNGVVQETFDYDAAGRVWRSTAGDGVTRYMYHDAAGRVTLTVSPVGALSTYGSLEALTTWLTNNGANAIGAVNPGTAALSFSLYDNRGLVVGSRQPFAQLSRDVATGVYTTATLTQSRTYNAFGEVLSETDGRGFTTDFTYNTMGRLIETRRPEVAFTNESGVVANARPTEQNRYDISGRLVATRTANGFWTSRTLLAGSGHNGEEAIATSELFPDQASITYGVDVFGDVRKITNQLGYVTLQNYDKAGQLISVQHPGRAAYTPGNNTGSLVQLTDYYAYDGLGQRIQHWNSQFGTGFKEKTVYDREGRVVSQIDFEGRATTYAWTWDATLTTRGLGAFGGWLVSTSHTSGKTSLEYKDGFGRLASKLSGGVYTSRQDLGGRRYALTYDLGGRMIQQTSGAAGSGLSTGLGNVTWDWFNTGLMSRQTDLTSGGTRADYEYDAAGNRLRERYATGSTVRQDGHAQYDALGRMIRYEDHSVSSSAPTSTDWTYDLNGNIRSSQSDYYKIGSSQLFSTSTFWNRYDAMDRMVQVEATLTDGQIRLGRYLEYDAAGNRVRMLTETSVQTDIQTGWGEVWVPDPDPNPGGEGGEIIIDPGDGGGGHWESYPIYENRPGFVVENYDYTADGYLARVGKSQDEWNTTTDTVVRSAVTWRSEDIRDAMGRLTYRWENSGVRDGVTTSYTRNATYDRTGLVLSETTFTYVDDNVYSGVTAHFRNETVTYSYAEAGVWRGVVTQVSTTGTRDPWPLGGSTTPLPSSRVTYAYQWWDDARLSVITNDKDINDGGNPLHTSTFNYDVNGRVSTVVINDDRDRTVTFVTDANGQVLSRTEADYIATYEDPKDLYYYFNGQRIGEVTNNWEYVSTYVGEMQRRASTGPGSPTPFRYGNYAQHAVDFDLAYQALTPHSIRSGGTSWTVRDGDTLQGIAAAVWGDASLWYLIAEANGLTSASLLSPGQTLTVPAKVGNFHNTSETFRPYDPNHTLGDINPTQVNPPKNSRGCGVIGQIIMVVIAVAVSVWTAGALAGPAASGLLGSIGTALGGTGSFGVAAAAGAVGSIASQAFGVATGIQDKFDWKAVGLSALSAGVAKGLGNWSKFTNFADKLARGNEAISAAIQGAAGSVVTQGVAVAVGLQDKFSWTSVAVSAASAGVGKAVGNALPDSFTEEQIDFVSGLAGGTAGAAVKSLIEGSSFGDNLLATLPSTIGQTLGNSIAKGISDRFGNLTQPRMARAEDQAGADTQAGAGALPISYADDGSITVSGTPFLTRRALAAATAGQTDDQTYLPLGMSWLNLLKGPDGRFSEAWNRVSWEIENDAPIGAGTDQEDSVFSIGADRPIAHASVITNDLVFDVFYDASADRFDAVLARAGDGSKALFDGLASIDYGEDFSMPEVVVTGRPIVRSARMVTIREPNYQSPMFAKAGVIPQGEYAYVADVNLTYPNQGTDAVGRGQFVSPEPFDYVVRRNGFDIIQNGVRSRVLARGGTSGMVPGLPVAYDLPDAQGAFAQNAAEWRNQHWSNRLAGDAVMAMPDLLLLGAPTKFSTGALGTQTVTSTTRSALLRSARGFAARQLDDVALGRASALSGQLGAVQGTYSGVVQVGQVGPLSDDLAATFAGGRYDVVRLESDRILYRAGTADQPLGQFFGVAEPGGVLQTRIDQAVLPRWPNGAQSPIDTAFGVRIPAGTEVYVGRIGNQGGAFVGGTDQIVVVRPWTIEGVEIVSRRPIN